MDPRALLPFEGEEYGFLSENIDPVLQELVTDKRVGRPQAELFDPARFPYASPFSVYEVHNPSFKADPSSLFAMPENLYPLPRHPSPGESNSSRSSAYHPDEMGIPSHTFCPLSPFSTSSPNPFEHKSLPYLELGGGSSVAPRDIQYVQDEQPELGASNVEPDLLHGIGFNMSHSYHRMDELAHDPHQSYWAIQDDASSCADADGESVHPTSGDDASDSDYNPQVPSCPAPRRNSPRRVSHTGITSPGRTTYHRHSGSGVDSHGRTTSAKSSGGVVNGKIKKRTHHRSNSSSTLQRAFPCLLHPYSCDSTFSTKNEWKRHINTQHLRLGFWRCDQCPTSRNDGNLTMAPNDFNRKDLFTQHLRRMHLPKTEASAKKGASPKHGNSAKSPGPSEDIEALIVECQTRCYVKKRDPPLQSRCVFSSCAKDFEGPKNWEDRLEHVGRHLEKMAKAQERDGQGGLRPEDMWVEDPELRRWLEDEGLIEADGHGAWRVGGGVPVRE